MAKVPNLISQNANSYLVKFGQWSFHYVLGWLWDDWRLTKREGLILKKLDLEKAFDKVDWGFLNVILKREALGRNGDAGFEVVYQVPIILSSSIEI